MQLDLARAAPAPIRKFMDGLSPSWRVAMTSLCAVWLALIVLFIGDWAAMGRQWWDSSTYNHILLIPAILGWLVTVRWPQLKRLQPQAWWPGLLWFAGGAFVWVLGGFAGFSLLSQAGVVIMFQGSAIALLGPQVSAGLAFPLFYMVFLVPFGDEFIPALQLATARITMALLHGSGVPASIQGVFITTPRGYFEVAEACSGVKFLIAMVAYGTLVANVCFRSWPRRAALLAACFVVPILANGVRAWGTIFIAQYRGVEFAAGFDHIFYGWVFFAIVMGLVMAMSWPFFDRPMDDPIVDAPAVEENLLLRRLSSATAPLTAVLAALGAIVLAVSLWAFAADRMSATIAAQIHLPDVPGWHRVDYAPAHTWQPVHQGADHRLLGRYVDGAGHVVDVSYALYSRQGDGAEAGGFGQGAVPLGSDWAWASPAPGPDGGLGERIQAPDGTERIAVTWYRTDGMTTGSNLRLKLANIRDRLLVRATPTATLIVSSEQADGGNAESAITAFLASIGAPGPWMDRIGAVE
ncbi:exosortase A [Novosphingobium sp. ZN18A2]|uniref:exosortase A n=1 Tax=Novosphingobium sp. ZN18A2 TaxID=3079861 RepID=UPI0030D22F36